MVVTKIMAVLLAATLIGFQPAPGTGGQAEDRVHMTIEANSQPAESVEPLPRTGLRNVENFVQARIDLPIVEIAEAEVLDRDNHENPDRLHVCKYTKWYKGDPEGLLDQKYYDQLDWCCIFVAYCAEKTDLLGEDQPFVRTGRCSTMAEHFVDMGYAFYDYQDAVPFGGTYMPEPGDILLWRKTSVYGHIGIVVEIDGDTVWVVNGNNVGRVRRSPMTIDDGYCADFLENAQWVHVIYPGQEEMEEEAKQSSYVIQGYELLEQR